MQMWCLDLAWFGDLTKSSASTFQISLEASAVLKQSILSNRIAPLDIDAHAENSKNVARKWKVTEDKRNVEEVENLIKRLPQEKADLKQHLTRITSHKCSSWLSANPWEDLFFLWQQMNSEILWLVDMAKVQKICKLGVMVVWMF